MAQPAEKKQLVGVWEVKVSPVGQSQSPELSLAMYGGDGSFTTGGRYKALPPISAVQDVANEPSYSGYPSRPGGREQDDRRGMGSEDDAGWAVSVSIPEPRYFWFGSRLPAHSDINRRNTAEYADLAALRRVQD